MISSKERDIRRTRASKMSKKIERLCKENKCRECTVVVTRMNFAKILGKFTKVKIQYESDASKPKQKSVPSANSNARLKRNENCMVLIHRNAYNQHPVKEPSSSKNRVNSSVSTPRTATNILKENNRLIKRPAILKNDICNLLNNNSKSTEVKHYGVVFLDPPMNNNKDHIKSKGSLAELLSGINESILPCDKWLIDYFPKSEEPKEDKVYDRIAAELEHLMYNKKTTTKSEIKPDATENNDFPSIMDILNDNSNAGETIKLKDQNIPVVSNHMESNDVEAMLLGETNSTEKSVQINIDNVEMNKLLEDVEQLNSTSESNDPIIQDQNSSKLPDILDNPHSPSILDEALQKGIEEHLPVENLQNDEKMGDQDNNNIEKGCKKDLDVNMLDISVSVPEKIQNIDKTEAKTEDTVNKSSDTVSKSSVQPSDVTHVVFNKIENGICCKSVTCCKNLKFTIELEGKSVELVGAPKFVTTLEDLQVLLQIVDETDKDSVYIE